VTGGAGFIGCALSSTLPDHFDRVVAMDNLYPQVHPTSIALPLSTSGQSSFTGT